MTTAVIPPQLRNILLDLDETLISAVEIRKLSKDPQKMAQFQERSKRFNVHQMDNDYYIVERPGVQPFLDFVFKHFNVSVWTAASKEYAIFVLKHVILRPGRKIDYFMCSENCDASYERTGCLKQLNQLFHLPRYNPSNTMIIDDNDNVQERQSNPVWPIKAFRFFRKQSEADTHLPALQKALEKKLVAKKNPHQITNNV
jgi:TFIIF-interacting CTD phosphatase-like protein